MRKRSSKVSGRLGVIDGLGLKIRFPRPPFLTGQKQAKPLQLGGLRFERWRVVGIDCDALEVARVCTTRLGARVGQFEKLASRNKHGPTQIHLRRVAAERVHHQATQSLTG
jgi:hypothetical protein